MGIAKVLLILFTPLFASHEWFDTESAQGSWKDASTRCERIGAKLPPRLVSLKALHNLFFNSTLAELMPWQEYQLGGIIGDEKYSARVFWMAEHVTDPVYKDIWFVGAQVKDTESAYSQPHVQDSTSHFSIIYLHP